ncbi:ComF family protein [Pseudomonas atacamensis]|uniref:ComF family protein n=1 Tax=Pseudomonas atacamensis TaxID=2565368 RepID=UPI002B480D67|nr:ComF family protein [Pseudomonas atacamensis]MEB2854098.1 ComF family protein [Pseudomonas atacamensis]
MIVQVKQIFGSWDLGYTLHKHTISSTHMGHDNNGNSIWDTKRSEPGQALFQLKYRNDYTQVGPIAAELQKTLIPLFQNIGMIIPMPASNVRARQPVDEIANELGRLANIRVFNNIIVKSPAPQGSSQLKDMATRQEKDAALAGRFSINPVIKNEGCWNALLLDDLFDSGATMDAVCKVLKTYPKINKIYAAAVTWK